MRSALMSLVLVGASLGIPAGVEATGHPAPPVVVALIDSGINPYHPAFRDHSRAHQHPSEYIPNYPDFIEPLHLTLDAPTMQEALEADAEVWAAVRPSTLYWVPGTRIVAWVSFAAGGTRCDSEFPDVPPANGVLMTGCTERVLLDDHGHGTMTASRAAGEGTSLAPDARIVAIEGLGTRGVAFASDLGWVDVQSNSWGSLAPGVGNRRAIEGAAAKHMVLFASGNGIAFSGAAPTPTQTHTTRAKGALQVGAHDNGHVSAWSDAPAHLVADGYGAPIAPHDSLDPISESVLACCTSAAAPYAAGAAAAILQHARHLLGDETPGIEEDPLGGSPIAASGTPVLGSMLLEDGVFTLEEWKRLLLLTAEARPRAGLHDGWMNFMGGPDAPDRPQHGPGENPYCLLCVTAPLAWTEVPYEVPAYMSIGYGATNERSLSRAIDVLDGTRTLNSRPDEDAFFGIDDEYGTVRP
jgi:subtilisin family serine protease